MKKIIFLIFLAVYYLGVSCSPVFYTYVTEGKEVYYGIQGYKDELEKLEKANADKFVIINPYFGKDNKSVYYQAAIIKDSDPATFQFLGGVWTLIGSTGYSKDKKNVYSGIQFWVQIQLLLHFWIKWKDMEKIIKMYTLWGKNWIMPTVPRLKLSGTVIPQTKT